VVGDLGWRIARRQHALDSFWLIADEAADVRWIPSCKHLRLGLYWKQCAATIGQQSIKEQS
jgi:hypothetical protein